MLSCLTQQKELLQSLAVQVNQEAQQDNLYFCLAAQFTWVDSWCTTAIAGDILVLDAGAKEEIQKILSEWDKFTGNLILIAGLEEQTDPQTFLVKLAEVKQKRCPQRHFHWLVLVSPQIEEDFRGLQTFLDGKSHWLDLRLAVTDLEQSIDELWQSAWLEPSPLSFAQRQEARRTLPDWLGEIAQREGELGLEPISLLQAKLSLLKGLTQESQGERGRKQAQIHYQESLDVWQLLGDNEPILWLSLRLAYLSLLQAYGENSRGHKLWQQTRHHTETAIAILESQQWHFAHGDILNLTGQVLRGLEDWEQMRQVAENSLVFFYQLSPFIGTDTTPERSEAKPWTPIELQSHTAMAYAYLCEALVEQWKFDEASEALKRAFDTHPKEVGDSDWDYRPCLGNLNYLSGRIQLANDQVKEALKTLRQAQTMVDFYDCPWLYFALLVELRECYLQLGHWLAAVGIDQEYQRREYSIGQRAFIGPRPLPCWPEQRICRHPLAPEGILGGKIESLSTPDQAKTISLTWQQLQEAWEQRPVPVLVLTGEDGGGKTSWLAGEVMQKVLPEQLIFLEFTNYWAERLLGRLGENFTLPCLGNATTEEIVAALTALPVMDLLLVLDGDSANLPWHQSASPRQQELAQGFWQWLLIRPQPQGIRLLITLPPTEIANLYTQLDVQLSGEETLPPLQYITLPPITLTQAEHWLVQVMGQSRHPWPPNLQSQVLGDLAIETGWEQEPWLHPLDLQMLGSILEQEQITQSVDYQGKKLNEWLTLAIHQYLSFLPPAPFKKALELLKSLTDEHLSLSLKSDYQLLTALYTPQESQEDGQLEFAPEDMKQLKLLLQVLCQGRLVSIIYQGKVGYYRLSTPNLAHALEDSVAVSSSVLVGVGRRGNRTNSGFGFASIGEGDLHQQSKNLIAELEKETGNDAQVAAQKLKSAELQYQKLVAGIDLEKQCQIILKQFATHSLEALLAAVEMGRELQRLITPETPLVEYPSLAPFLALHNILSQIHEQNRFQHRNSVTCLQVSPPVEHSPPLVLTATSDGIAYLWSFHGELVKVLRGHQGAITAVEWSPDGQHIATASADHTVKLWQRQGEEVSTLRGHEDWVTSVHFSPNHQFLITGSRDTTVRIWNFAGEQLTHCQGHSNWVRNAEFNCNGQILLSASRDGTARLWDLEGREIGLFQGHTGWVRNAQFSPDGQWVVTASADGTARLWELSGKCFAILKGHQNWIRNALWSADGQYILTASADGTARLWSAKGKCLSILQGHDHTVHEARFSPGGRMIVTCSADGTARLWNQAGSQITILRGHQKDVYDAVFSNDGQFVFTISGDYTARQWDIAPKKTIVLSGHGHWVRNAHFNAKGDRLLTVSRDKTARLWNMQGKCLAVLEEHQGRIRAGQFSPDGQWVVTAAADKTAQLWNVFGKKLTTLRGHQDALLNVCFSPDSRYIVTASKDGTARVWNSTGRELAVLRHYDKTIFSAEFSRDGQFVVTASDDHTAGVWEIIGREVGICRGHEGPVYSAQFSPDGRYVLTASADHTARIWDFLGRPLSTLIGHQNVVYEAQFSPDGNLIVTASGDRTARIWNRKGKLMAILYGHHSSVNTAHWSADGQLIVTSSNDGTARLWDRSGRELGTLQGHSNWVRSAEFSQDGNWIVTASTDGTARLWPVESLAKLIVRGRNWLKDYLGDRGDQ